MSEQKFRFKNPFTCRLTDEEREANEEIILEEFPQFNAETSIRTVINALVQRAAQKTIKAQAADLAEIARLKTEVERLNSLLEQLPSPEALEEERQLSINEIGRLKTDLTLKDDEILILKSRTPDSSHAPGVTLGENDEIITFDPIFAGLVDIEIEAAQRKKGILYTRAQVLKNLFLDMIKGRDSYPLCKMWSTADLVTYKKKITNPQN